MPDATPNPYKKETWFWDDLDALSHGPYATEQEALYALLRHEFENNRFKTPDPSTWWDWWKKFWHDA